MKHCLPNHTLIRQYLLFLALLAMGSFAYAATGDFLYKFGERATISLSEAMSIDRDGNIYLVAGFSDLAVLDSDGNVNVRIKEPQADLVTGNWLYFYDIDYGNNGEIYALANIATNPITSRIRIYDSGGVFLNELVVEGTYHRIAAVHDGSAFYLLSGTDIKKVAADGTVLLNWGEFGLGEGQLWYPRDIALTPGGDVLVANANNILVFSSTGSYLKTITNGSMQDIQSLVVADNGQILYSDRKRKSVVLLRLDGTAQLEWLVRGKSIGMNGDGEVYVLEGSSIYLYTIHGQYVRKIVGGNDEIDFIQDMTIAPDGNLYLMTQFNIIKVFSRDGFYTREIELPYSGRSFDVDQFGNIYVLHGSWVTKYSNNGDYLFRWGKHSYNKQDGTFYFPNGLVVNSLGNVLVVDQYRHDIQEFTPNGHFVRKISEQGFLPGQLYYPDSIEVDAADNIFVRQRYEHHIQVLDSNGGFLAEFGPSGIEDGQFAQYGYFDVDDSGTLYASEMYGNLHPNYQHLFRVQVFDSTGGLLTRWGNENTGDELWTNKLIAVEKCGERVFVYDQHNYSIKVFEGRTCSVPQDTTPPEIVLPVNNINEAASSIGAVVHYSVVATDDTDPDPVINCTPASGSLFAIATTTVSCSATDQYGNTSYGSFTIWVQDTVPPVLTLPEIITAEASSLSGAIVDYGVSVTDTVDPDPVLNCTPASGSLFAIATTTVSCSATDQYGNTSYGSFTIWVQDTVPPVLTLPEIITAEATSLSGAVVGYGVSATDTVDPDPVISCTPASGSLFAIATTTVNCSATDQAGNTSYGSFTIWIQDTVPPVLTLPEIITAEATSLSGAIVDYGVSVTDTVDPDPVLNCTPASGSQFAIATTTVNCSATDQYGNSTSGHFTVKVQDTTPPELLIPEDLAVIASGDQTSVNTGSATADDLVGPVIIINDAPTTFPIGTTHVTWTATDYYGNSSTDIQTIVVSYQFMGFLKPVEHGGIYKLGRTLPIKIQLAYDDNRLVSDASVTLQLYKLSNTTVSGEALDVDSSNSANTDDQFRFTDEHYIYNLNTKNIDAGLYRVVVSVNDGNAYSIDFALK